MRYDVIVAGAGPAGSTVARECATRGLSVLLLEKERFPRDKPCGGGVNVRTARLLPFDLAPVVERQIFGVQFSLRQSSPFTRRAAFPFTYITQRSRLDAFLAEQAVAAGVILREQSAVREVERYSSHVVVRAGGQTYDGHALVAADGANGPTARLAGLPVRRWVGIALEANITPHEAVMRLWDDRMGIDLGAPPQGYGWLFPRADHLNVGVGGWNTGPHLRARLDRLLRFYGLDPTGLWGLRGYPLPVRQGGRLADGNVLSAGDAAGLLDPLTGEGIYGAVWSGIIAARHLAAYVAGEVADLRGYEAELRRNLIPELGTAEQCRDLVSASPRAFVALIERLPGAWGLVCRFLRGDQTYVGFRRGHRGYSAAITLLSRCIRAGARVGSGRGGQSGPAGVRRERRRSARQRTSRSH